MSRKFHITVPDGLAAELEEAAVERGITAGELIQQILLENLRRSRSCDQRNPLASITGIVDGEETDLVSRVNEILYR